MKRIVVGVSGASGIVLAYRAIKALGDLGHEIELVISQHALYTAALEMGKEFSTTTKFISRLPENVQERVRIHSIHDVGAPIASGSFQTDGMLIIPCSMATVAAISIGLGDNCLRRAADVTLKEKRPLVIVPRETPLSTLHLENLLHLSKLGASIVPPMPGWYNGPKSLEDVENFIVGRTLDALKLENDIYERWRS